MTLAEKLDELFKTAHKPGERELTYKEASEGIKRETGVSISPALLWQLRHGKKSDPRVSQLEAIARFFGVSPSLLLSSDPNEDREAFSLLAQMRRIRDSETYRHIAARAAQMSDEDLEAISYLLDRMSREPNARSRSEDKSTQTD